MIFGEVVIDAHQRGRVVVQTLIGRQRRCQWQTEALDQTQKARDGIRIGAQALQRQRIGGKERQKRIGATRKSQRAERKELVLDDRSAGAEADLVLGVFLTERFARVVDELEARVAVRVAKRALHVVGAATGG